MTADIGELRRLLSEATQLSWEQMISATTPGKHMIWSGDFLLAERVYPSDAALIVAAVNGLPDLLDRLEALEAKVEATSLAYIEAMNPGIDMEEVKADRALRAEQDTSPRHPLYVRADQPLVRFP